MNLENKESIITAYWCHLHSQLNEDRFERAFDYVYDLIVDRKADLDLRLDWLDIVSQTFPPGHPKGAFVQGVIFRLLKEIKADKNKKLANYIFANRELREYFYLSSFNNEPTLNSDFKEIAEFVDEQDFVQENNRVELNINSVSFVDLFIFWIYTEMYPEIDYERADEVKKEVNRRLQDPELRVKMIADLEITCPDEQAYRFIDEIKKSY